jgi:hypothetical protein
MAEGAATSAAVSRTGSAQVSADRANPSGIVLRDNRAQVASFFVVLAVILVAVGITVPLAVHDGPWLGVMTIMGSVIIVSLLSAAAVPHLRQHH